MSKNFKITPSCQIMFAYAFSALHYVFLDFMLFGSIKASTKKTEECVRDLDKLNLVELGYDGSFLGSCQFLLLPQLPQK